MSNTTLDILRPRSHLITVLSDTYIHILHTYYNESMHKSIDQCNWFWIYSCIFFAFSLQYLRNTPLYNFFHKKISYRTFWCIMSLPKTLWKKVILYDKNIIQRKKGVSQSLCKPSNWCKIILLSLEVFLWEEEKETHHKKQH